ncbi:MAG: hypothetical protein HKN79_04490 [Flavobacteriales bacterium]|nr:hypothetical protein [Flavobacteriales bacterium]
MGLWAQTFSEDQVSYLEEISDLFISQDKKQGKKFIEEEFTPFWNGALDPSVRTDIYELSNTFGKLRFRAFPEFHDFLSTAIRLQTSADPNYSAWIETLRALSRGKKSKLTDFNETVARAYRNGLLVDKSTVQWKYKSESGFTIDPGKDPSLIFETTDLVCYAKRDSSNIYATSGVYDILSKNWEGKDGKVDWQRAGLDPDKVYADLKTYSIGMKSSSYNIDSVLFYNEFFERPLLGSLKEKVIAGRDKENSSFPQFDSYEQRLRIEEIAPNMVYDGGFSMKGRRLVGTGTVEQPARLVIYRDDRPFLISNSLAYIIRPDRIASDNARITIYMSEDSITHPGVQLGYIKEDNLLSLVRTDEGISKSPFYNSYHDLEMYFEALYWNLGEPVMTMGNLFGSSNTKAAFESKDYYQERRYYALQGIDPINPLVRVRDLVKEFGDGFYASDFARATRLPPDVAKRQLIILANQGFLQYDLESDYVIVRDKLEDYVMNRAGKRDYDILLFNSDIGTEANATLNLINYDLLLKGVRKINLSDSQRVSIYPDGRQLTVKKDRDFLFDGVTVAGNLELFGSDCRFAYEDFKVDIAQLDSVRLNVEKFDWSGMGKVPMVQVTNVLEGGRGVLSVDDSRNKSGLKGEEFPFYPKFESLDESYVYYDDSSIQGGAYDRSDFFFKVEPYSLDSLDNFVANNIALDGTLVSGIFPNIDHPLTVQPDYSLGFEMNTSSNGLMAYQGKNRFNEKVILNGNGLQGDGVIEYLTATATGEAFVFLPDSTIGVTSSFVNLEQSQGVRVPEVSADAVRMTYVPDSDYLRVQSLQEDISCFNGQAAMDGQFTLRPDGLTGIGTMDLSDAELESPLFTYTESDIYADTSDFRLTGLETDFAFKTEDVNAHIDFVGRKGEFKANGEASFVEFPANQYVCYMDKFIWFMDQNDLALEYDGQVSNDFVIDTDLDLTKSNFFSTREDQDSLNFMSPKAVYDLDQSIINCKEIEFIKVADARISPDSGKVVIRKRAKMDPLNNATIVANFVTKFHTLTNADLEIHSSKDYEGSGDYTYVDEVENEQLIRFNDIRVDSSLQTVAEGTILSTADFSISPAFQYSGEVDLYANTKGLYFRGRTRVFHDCDLDKNWMNFEAAIDPEEVYIPVDTALTDETGLPVGIGLLMDDEILDLYCTFLSAIRSDRDEVMMSSSGVLTYDKKSKEYLVGPRDKLRERNLTGNLIALSTQSCQVRGEGQFNFGLDLGQVDMRPVGRFVNNTAEEKFNFTAMFPLDFHFSEQAMKSMAEDFEKFPQLKPLVLQNSVYPLGLKEILGLEEADKLISQLTLTGSVKKLPAELASTMVLTDIFFKWDAEEALYVSEGPIGLASLGKKEVFAQVNGIIRMQKKRGGDAITIYLEMDDEHWYYFDYTRTLMQAYSSNQEFNDIVMNTKEDERKMKGEKGEDPYNYLLSSKRKKDIFLEDMEDMGHWTP